MLRSDREELLVGAINKAYERRQKKNPDTNLLPSDPDVNDVLVFAIGMKKKRLRKKLKDHHGSSKYEKRFPKGIWSEFTRKVYANNFINKLGQESFARRCLPPQTTN